ncbi:hypothetical protein CSHISOI_07222 [Colletotrichum shisoi]|uniref:Uncharacterized protein n=1 Tax=Colletotrichum shisoi TaxID=2078593 RepID=A0A5Q4BNG8_9PEZI|nr:hypothetical protein CSHISOI_07222 [Colletotrichum shisoi]
MANQIWMRANRRREMDGRLLLNTILGPCRLPPPSSFVHSLHQTTADQRRNTDKSRAVLLDTSNNGPSSLIFDGGDMAALSDSGLSNDWRFGSTAEARSRPKPRQETCPSVARPAPVSADDVVRSPAVRQPSTASQ